MQRRTVGSIAALLLVIGLTMLAIEPSRDSTFALAAIRVGIVMAVLWLAWPQLVSLPRWMMFTLLGAAAVVSWRPKALLFALPVLVILAVLRRRWGSIRSAARKDSGSL